MDEPASQWEVGDRIAQPLPPGTVQLGNRALVDLGGTGHEIITLRFIRPGEDVPSYVSERKALLADDPRTLPQPRPLSTGSEVEIMKDMTVLESLQCPHLEGPQTASWHVDTVAQTTGAGFGVRHHRWVRESGVNTGDRSVFEHQVLSTITEAAISVDRLNVKTAILKERRKAREAEGKGKSKKGEAASSST